ncbi:hypothetical protein VTN77DRAFT_8766 [Rasamsonia byssochlamydoides]|uniref:uncharacterized protein n=1 Tax=Rasamsonia byssochlamydoides TaxID=89139 RepID=UPI003742EE83
MAVGRVAHYYDPPLYQGTVDTAVTLTPGCPDKVKRVRWHPHLTGWLLSPFGRYPHARAAHQKFQEIVRRDTHQLKVVLKSGDLYIWNNFKILHRRERVLETPRTGVGQTVPEQVVADRYRELLIKKLVKSVDEDWLVQMPTQQLRELANLVE